MNPITIQMAPMARKIVEQVLAIKPGEHVLLITDTGRPPTVTQAIASAVAAVAEETVVITMNSRTRGGEEFPPVVAAAMLGANAIIMQTSYSTFHTNAVRAALASGARTCGMWGFDEEMMLRGGITADYEEVRRTSERLAGIMARGKRARLTTPEGTDITVSLEGRKTVALFGMAHRPGQNCGLPDGEATFSPLEGSAEGVLVNPFTIEKHEIAFPREPVRVEVREGRVISVTGGSEAAFFARVIEEAGENAGNVAEFAVGTNPEGRLGANLREAKIAWGTAHVGIGDNRSLGGSVYSPMHIDMIFRNPTVTVDETVLVRDGRIVA